MMGHQRVEQAALFYEFSLDRHVPADLLLRSIDRFVDLDGLRRDLVAFYSAIGRPSIAPELMIRMLSVGYCFGIRSERRLCEEVYLNLAYRWFCRLGLDGDVPDIQPSRGTGMAASAIVIVNRLAKFWTPIPRLRGSILQAE
jgi:transposase